MSLMCDSIDCMKNQQSQQKLTKFNNKGWIIVLIVFLVFAIVAICVYIKIGFGKFAYARFVSEFGDAWTGNITERTKKMVLLESGVAIGDLEVESVNSDSVVFLYAQRDKFGFPILDDNDKELTSRIVIKNGESREFSRSGLMDAFSRYTVRIVRRPFKIKTE